MQYCLGVPPLCEADFTSMKKSISRSFPPLGPLLNIMENIGCFESCPPEHRPLLELLGSSSPACALIPYNVVNEQILSKMFDSPKDISRDAELLNSIQINIPLLFEILKSVSFEISPEYKEIISEVFAKSKDTFPNPSACTSDQFPKPKTEDPLTKEELDIASQTAFFPKLVPIRQRGRYTADKGKFNAESCRKDSTRHPTLLPGIFTVFCEHGICYGFQIMENNESPNVPFTFIRTRFLTAPSVVIYDNACNLHAYFLNRDPLFVQNTTFAVDNLHWRNHKSCSKIYHAKNIPLLDGVNTQMVEQNNSKLRKLKSQLSYMNHQNFMSHLKFFLWHCNKRVLDKK
ncbi:uncharacterized protein LOC128168947 [Crassostrea angulata]|nr:uncharacterized protein LOC128164224 [Crassostrea angulata]XP_052691104.1 uncharacterized protein LOC128168947 [Crassostrea angulata]